ncbi:MAG: hypothetical protein WDN44_11340 [Sphingomonas sp.]
MRRLRRQRLPGRDRRVRGDPRRCRAPRLINDGGDGAIVARHAFLNAPNLGSAARALVREGVTTAGGSGSGVARMMPPVRTRLALARRPR